MLFGQYENNTNSVKKSTKEKQIKKIDYSKTVKENERIQIAKIVKLKKEFYTDFDKEKYPYSLNFYDFEVFYTDWILTIINPVELKKYIIVNDTSALKKLYEKKQNEIFVGYNSRSYDTVIFKAILLGMNVKKVSDDIILRNMKGWQINENFRDIQLLNFDIYTKNSLKALEGFMGDDMRESDVDINLERKLTNDEIELTLKYNLHDVKETIEVFRRAHELYDSHINLIETFNLPISYISFTQAQMTARILQCEKIEHNDEFDIEILDCLRIKKYKSAINWFTNENNLDYKKSFSLDVCGIKHQFGWGGLHGCADFPLHEKGDIYHIDVASYYPSIMIEYDFLTRNSQDKSIYAKIKEMRLTLKAQGKKKEQAPYKIVLNGAYGMMKDKYSLAYDPRNANNVCINGQLMLLDLLEHLEPHITLIQSNTDGLIVKTSEIDTVKAICAKWTKRTKMNLEFDKVKEIWQKDVNNYLMIFDNGKVERKGAYVLELNDLTYDLPIINKSIVDYLINKTSIETTINNCDELREFQKVVKITSLYEGAWHNNKYLPYKHFRVFASKDYKDTYLGKYKYKGATIEKFANTPLHLFIQNESVKNAKCPQKLDKQWYIDLAKKRLNDFGIENDDKLF